MTERDTRLETNPSTKLYNNVFRFFFFFSLLSPFLIRGLKK